LRPSGEQGEGDAGDNWTVESDSMGSQWWERGKPVQLKHTVSLCPFLSPAFPFFLNFSRFCLDCLVFVCQRLLPFVCGSIAHQS
jgi:hypothetical protein